MHYKLTESSVCFIYFSLRETIRERMHSLQRRTVTRNVAKCQVVCNEVTGKKIISMKYRPNKEKCNLPLDDDITRVSRLESWLWVIELYIYTIHHSFLADFHSGICTFYDAKNWQWRVYITLYEMKLFSPNF